MGWLVFVLLILVGIIAYAFVRNCNQNYRIGSGMFKNSEYNLDEKDDLQDKDYYDDHYNLYK